MNKTGERGSTLMMVTWIIAVLGVIVTFLLYRAEVEWAAAASLEKTLRFRQVAEEVLHARLAVLATDDTPIDNKKDPWYGDGKINMDWNVYTVTIITEDEGSKPNLNLTTEDGLKQVLDETVSPDPVLDWMDSDSEQRPNGAELGYYQEQKPPYKSRDGFFSSMEELMAVKDSDKIYPALQPEFTVYGKINPNTISPETLATLLLCNGFEKGWVERVVNDFNNFRINNRVTKIDDFLGFTGVTLASRDKLKPLFKFTGSCNLNLVSKKGLKANLKNWGQPPERADDIINRRDQQPFENPTEYGTIFRPRGNQNFGEDYFTLVSTIIRYRIWVTKGDFQCYLETVQERTPNSAEKAKWKMRTLTWRFLYNKDVPEIPVTEPTPGPSGG